MQSFKSKEYVKEAFAWRHYYWYLSDSGLEYLRTYLNLPSEIVPATMKKSSRPATGRPMEVDRPPRRDGGYGDRPGGDRGEYRSAGGFGRGTDKGGAPGAYQPRFGGEGGAPGGGFGRGRA